MCTPLTLASVLPSFLTLGRAGGHVKKKFACHWMDAVGWETGTLEELTKEERGSRRTG